ncbi:uncharacterized protein LOC108871974 [Brassica rapa]|uniref:uncharacterized protein LOC108871974 n=1 Tax=Brassica campestris TaxID=3711 RepID=UPI00142D8B81|nr:uncharacterized protein LOC108871974 [Brassica rapa]XP_033146806.1 uncharacterized protein LOC108871974 [Brassica rapa]
MVSTLIIVRDNNGDLHDQEGHLRNAAGQRIYAQRAAIPESDAHATGTTLHVDEVALPKTLADYNRPNQFYTNKSAIRPPTIQRDSELKAQYYTLVGQISYHGLSHEHLMDHLERFKDLISAIKVKGVLEDYLLCKLFKFSLAREASHWLKQLPPGSLTSWSDIKNAFLCNLFDEAHAEDLRSKITTFSQGLSESFRGSWIIFKSYQRNYPHHGFNEVQLLCTFYRGIAVQYQMGLDASSNGNFNTRNPEEVVKVIENLASSNSTKNSDFERKKSATILGNDQMDEVKVKLDSVHKLLRKQVCLVEDTEAVNTEGRAEEEEEVNFIGGTQNTKREQ